MGCCHPEKKPEENEILSFFHKMEKENKFNLTIENYQENYDTIVNLSSNSFKKLKKKQQVRIGFLGEIIKNFNKIYTEEKEERITKRIIFYILILTLTLENYINERKELNISNNNNDLQQFLLTIIIKILDKNFKEKQNLKVVLYYMGHMLIILFSEIKDISLYFNVEKYIDLINIITSNKNVLNNNEIYPFIKVNIYCLGICFMLNYPEIKLNNNSINILIEYYVKAYFFNLSFLLENYTVFNKYLFIYNNINNNKIVNNYNFTNKIIVNDLINKNNNYLGSNIKNYVNVNDISNYSMNQSRYNYYRTSYISNMDEFSYNNNDFLELVKAQEFQDIQSITFSLYSFLKTTIQDILFGKKIFKLFGDKIEETYKKNNNNLMKRTSLVQRNSTNSLLQEKNFNTNIIKIIYLFLFNKCKIENDKIITLSFLDYISDKIKKEKHKEQYYDILLQIFFLFNNEQIKQIIITLLSKTFIKEIENLNSYDFIEELFGVSQSNNFFLFGSKRMKILKHFLINTSSNFKGIQNTNLKIKILIKLSDVLNKYIKNYNKNFSESPSPEMSSSDNSKYKLNKEELLTFYNNFELDNDNFDDNNNNYYFVFINYVKFYITFSHFLEYNFVCAEIYKELEIRKKAFNKQINFITQLEILSIQGEKSYVNDIIKLTKLIIKIVEKNSIDCFEDFQILCGYFGEGIKKLSNISNKHKIIDFHFLKLSYSVLIFILIQLKKIFRLPSSIIKIHKEIIECIKEIKEDISLYLDEMNNELYSNSKLSKKIYQDLKNYLKSEKKLDIEPKIFRQIMDIIYSKIFGKTSSLFIFLKSQNCKIIKEEKKMTDNIEITEETVNSFQNFNYINDIALKFVEDKNSNFSFKHNEEDSQRLNLPKINDSKESIIFNKKCGSSSEQEELTDKIKI